MKKGWTDIDISKLVKADWNYKEEDETQTKKLIENFKRNGQIENLLIRELETGFYEVVNGNHRFDVMNELKLKKAHVFNFGKISQEQAIRLAIETNETRFQANAAKLGELIKEIQSEFKLEELAETMPYSEEDLNNMIEVIDFDWENFASDQIDTFGDTEFDKKITVNVTNETLNRWNELKDKFQGIIGYENESKVFEFAIIEALNIPLRSLE